MMTHSTNVACITWLLAKVAELTEAVLRGPTDDEEEDIQKTPPPPFDNMMRRRLVAEDSATRKSPPSDMSNPSIFALHRPPTHADLPLALLQPIFAEFVADAEHLEPNPEDNALVLELRSAMSEPWKDEDKQSAKFRAIIHEHYSIQLYPATVGSTKRTSDGHATIGQHMYLVFEMKGWSGNGDAEVQASLYALEALRVILDEKKDPLDPPLHGSLLCWWVSLTSLLSFAYSS